ncbi:MAG: hypothetical protein CM1200mP15_18620 [Dehalococcoidia bacterium]|nr:MAG: hypothetical protein CM1200mP15_18620 [Dehalococcoidia bacterium]
MLSNEYGPIPPEPRRLEPCHELVFTILSQHTSDTNSERAFTSLMKTFKTLENVANAPVKDIETAIKPRRISKNQGSEDKIRTNNDPGSKSEFS